ncbi:hypothetical protein OH76DRAFT_99532 [Lentinus brumalis]|uniref:Uncharacterized protein n=1 Tax=Lentinus brumalis TaxID=2498619 RepID=A0A371CQD5_9APHY|nr:hypothetical protein OH76DRAFT_99532 [Polyporus brumalis]
MRRKRKRVQVFSEQLYVGLPLPCICAFGRCSEGQVGIAEAGWRRSNVLAGNSMTAHEVRDVNRSRAVSSLRWVLSAPSALEGD